MCFSQKTTASERDAILTRFGNAEMLQVTETMMTGVRKRGCDVACHPEQRYH
jgi:hypothetical protein